MDRSEAGLSFMELTVSKIYTIKIVQFDFLSVSRTMVRSNNYTPRYACYKTERPSVERIFGGLLFLLNL